MNLFCTFIVSMFFMDGDPVYLNGNTLFLDDCPISPPTECVFTWGLKRTAYGWLEWNTVCVDKSDKIVYDGRVTRSLAT